VTCIIHMQGGEAPAPGSPRRAVRSALRMPLVSSERNISSLRFYSRCDRQGDSANDSSPDRQFGHLIFCIILRSKTIPT
jgi:hypothetical protein